MTLWRSRPSKQCRSAPLTEKATGTATGSCFLRTISASGPTEGWCRCVPPTKTEFLLHMSCFSSLFVPFFLLLSCTVAPVVGARVCVLLNRSAVMRCLATRSVTDRRLGWAPCCSRMTDYCSLMRHVLTSDHVRCPLVFLLVNSCGQNPNIHHMLSMFQHTHQPMRRRPSARSVDTFTCCFLHPHSPLGNDRYFQEGTTVGRRSCSGDTTARAPPPSSRSQKLVTWSCRA